MIKVVYLSSCFESCLVGTSWYTVVAQYFVAGFLILIFNRYEHGAITEELNLFLSAISIWNNLSFYKLMIS